MSDKPNIASRIRTKLRPIPTAPKLAHPFDAYRRPAEDREDVPVDNITVRTFGPGESPPDRSEGELMGYRARAAVEAQRLRARLREAGAGR